MMSFLPIPFLFLSVGLLIQAELTHNKQRVYLFKPLSTLLVMAVALLAFIRPAADPGYVLLILLGLFFSLGGDVALMFPSEQAFLLGVASFLLAQLVYGSTFAWNGALQGQLLWPGIIIGLVAVAFYLYLYPHLNRMKVPVGGYALVISLMLWLSQGLLTSPTFDDHAAWLVGAGAILFYISDVILAVDRFVRPFRLARLFNLSTYYAGQLLIALSTSYVLRG
jgi:uncharacterized membrane protein YhhN